MSVDAVPDPKRTAAVQTQAQIRMVVLAATPVAYLRFADSAALITGRPVLVMNPNQQVSVTVVADPKRTVAAQTRAQIHTVAWAAMPVA